MTPSPEQPQAPKVEQQPERTAGAPDDQADQKIDTDPYKAIEPKREEKISQAAAASKNLQDALKATDSRLVVIRQELMERRKKQSSV